MPERFSTTVTIDSSPAAVWAALTEPARMTEWLGGPEMELEVWTDWRINEPVIIRGFHHIRFENKGVVLQYDREKRLSYTHLSSVSRLPDKPESYSILDFILTPADNQTTLTLMIGNFPTESIRKHLEFYWRTTLRAIKQYVEDR